MSDTKLQLVEPTPTTEEEPSEDPYHIEIGQWFWVAHNDEKKLSEDPDNCWLGCVVHIGSNFAKLEGAGTECWVARIHFDVFWDQCRRESDPDAYIDSKVQHYQGEVKRLMSEVKEVTARLGVTPSPELTAGSETKALAKVGQGQDMGDYKKALVKAKNKTLPNLFKEIEKANEGLSAWMTARVIPLKAQAGKMEGVIANIEDRIFNVRLYAGLTEEVVQFADGEPAPLDAKIRLMQRRCYMDEECLAQYETGGMEFKDINDFDKWLARPENRDRLLPFPRTIVAFKVRREGKKRELINLIDFFSIIKAERADKLTFLYIRNGEKLYCMRTEIEFDEKLFPDMDHNRFDGSKLWADTTWSNNIQIITDDEYQGLKEDHAREVKEYRAKKKAYNAALRSPEAKARAKAKGLKKPDDSCVDVSWPGHRWFGDDPAKKYTPYSPANVYYDDISGKIGDDIKQHNRIALVIQGLLDRSPILHPHPPWQIWTQEGFAAALELIYDDSRALSAGEKPDFEAYRKRLNSTLKAGSVTVGQEDVWERYEGAKESRRMDNDYRNRSDWRPTHHRPYGNPGPGGLARVSTFGKRSRKATFAWNRERQASTYYGKSTEIRTTFTCSESCLLNVDAYTPGDFHIFFDDPRTRTDYLKWAPLLLEAEEFHAGNRKVKDPVPPEPKAGSTHEGRRRYRARKRKKDLMDKAVRLVREVTTQGGTTYKVGSLWRVFDGRGDTFSISGIKKDGTHDKHHRHISNVSFMDIEVDPSIPSREE